jgi:hypothetical protein
MQTAVSYQNGHGLCNVITGLSLVEMNKGRNAEALRLLFLLPYLT